MTYMKGIFCIVEDVGWYQAIVKSCFLDDSQYK